jgi:hypothetical protein
VALGSFGQTLSEDDLESQLDVEWFAGSDAWCVVARSDGRLDLPKTAGAKRVITQLLRSWVSKVQMIKQIEHLHPELRVDTLRNGSGLEEREIDVFKARPVDAVTSVVTIGSKCRVGKCARVDPLNDAALNRVGNAREGIAYDIGPLRIFILAGGVGSRDQVDRLAAFQRDDRVQLPSVGNKPWSTESGNIVVGVCNESIARIEVTVAVVALGVGAVLRQLSAVRRDLVQIVAPCVAETGWSGHGSSGSSR